MITPGAGSYNHDFSPIKTQPPKFSMRIKLDPKLSKLNVPGPGSYKNEAEKMRQQKAPSFGFGTSKRPEIGKNKDQRTPGPGDYRVNTMISNLPEYAMPGRTEEQKFV